MSTTLIADAGSTKTAWLLVDENGLELKRVVSRGINPVVMAAEQVAAVVEGDLLPVIGGCHVGRVRYYGAGVVSDSAGRVVADALAPIGCRDVEVASDMLGAARSLFGRRPGIACILGTGSNSCLYDGRRIVANVPPLGYILGDEGSGAAIAKRFIGDLFKGLLPREVAGQWYEETGLSMTDVIENVYRRPGANRFLASFMPLIIKLSSYDAVASIIKDELSRFFSRNVIVYDTDVREIGFVGSIAMHLRSRLEVVAAESGFKIHAVVADPVDGIAAYHAGDEKI